MGSKIRVVHIINSFASGGAEAMLCNLLRHCDRTRFELSVVSLIDDMTIAGSVLRAGIPVVNMGMRPGIPDPRGIVRLALHLRRVQPDVVQTWMDHSNLIGGVATRLGCQARVVWGIHASNHIAGVAKRTTRLTVSVCAKLSGRIPSRIIYCAERSHASYVAQGFASDNGVVIPNGFETDRFRPDPGARLALRQELGLGDDAFLVGLAARFDPIKDHTNFLRAAAIFANLLPNAHFVLCGAQVEARNVELVQEIAKFGLTQRCHLLGRRQDMPRVHAAMDVASSSSFSEAFPLAIGEAMACGVPCAATDVGDSALLVGSTGRIVPARAPSALAAAWSGLWAMGPAGRRQLGDDARRRIKELFDLGAITRRYEALYDSLASQQDTRPLTGRYVAEPVQSPAA